MCKKICKLRKIRVKYVVANQVSETGVFAAVPDKKDGIHDTMGGTAQCARGIWGCVIQW